MPRANRYILPGVAYHLTHRCHDRSFLLKHGVDRTLYRKMLRERLRQHPVSLLGYCITSNHTHLLAVARDSEADIGCFMQSLEGDFAQAYNLRKRTRSGAFWGDRYHAVMVDTGEYLWRCLKYIDLNMVRAGKVAHPQDWEWCGYRELVGLKRRNRLIDIKTLLGVLGDGYTVDSLRSAYSEAIQDVIEIGELAREPMWTESLAVGAESFAWRIGGHVPNRMHVTVEAALGRKGLWVARECRAAYGAKSGPRNRGMLTESATISGVSR